MKVYSRAAVGVALLALSAWLPNSAAAKSCNLITDPTGDAYLYRTGSAATVPDASLDLTGADIASNATAVTIVFKVAGISRPPSTSPGGERFYAEFTLTGAPDTFYVEGDLTASSEKYYAGYLGESLLVTQVRPQLGAATGVIDTAKNEVRITAPLSLFKGREVKFSAATKWTALTAFTGRMIAPDNGVTGNAVAPFADETEVGKTYAHMTASCVVVGK